MGTSDKDSFPNERPAHLVQVQGFWMDVNDVSNAEFAKFVEATGYMTAAERPVNWEDLKKELPPGRAVATGSAKLTPGRLLLAAVQATGSDNQIRADPLLWSGNNHWLENVRR